MKVDYCLIGERIKCIRLKRHLSQEKLSEMIERSPGYISLIEAGKKKASLETLLSICYVLNITLNELLVGNQPPLGSDYNLEYAELIAECDEDERRLIFELSKAAREVLRKNKISKNNEG
jgi:transcriptional regulator with XRE-family HTH domain